MGYGYSSDISQQELSNEYQHDRLWMVFKKVFRIFFQWTKVASTRKGLIVLRVFHKGIASLLVADNPVWLSHSQLEGNPAGGATIRLK